MRRRRSNTAAIDLFANIGLGFIALFLLVLLQVNPVAKQKDIDARAEYLVTIEWQDGSADDVDLWLRMPDGDFVSWVKKGSGPTFLDRDDLGTDNNQYIVGNEVRVANIRRETITVRTNVPGEYHVSVHLYLRRWTGPSPQVRVTILKLNPHQVIAERVIGLEMTGQEETAARFWVDEQGRVTKVVSDGEPWVVHALAKRRGGLQ
jgi:hypothetical protein